jgi:hypothetical protein
LIREPKQTGPDNFLELDFPGPTIPRNKTGCISAEEESSLRQFCGKKSDPKSSGTIAGET